MNTPAVLVACVGNIFLGDDAFGVAVASRLQKRHLSKNVKVVDFGIRGFDLGYALLEKYDLVILVDVVQRGEPPGTLYVIEPQVDSAAMESADAVQTHTMVPSQALRFARAMGAPLTNVRIVGCEPASFTVPEDAASELTTEVAHAVDEAVKLIEELVEPYCERVPCMN